MIDRSVLGGRQIVRTTAALSRHEIDPRKIYDPVPELRGPLQEMSIAT
jgi:hypothetical protein